LRPDLSQITLDKRMIISPVQGMDDAIWRYLVKKIRSRGVSILTSSRVPHITLTKNPECIFTCLSEIQKIPPIKLRFSHVVLSTPSRPNSVKSVCGLNVRWSLAGFRLPDEIGSMKKRKGKRKGKIPICRYFQNSQCWNGDLCPFLHTM